MVDRDHEDHGEIILHFIFSSNVAFADEHLDKVLKQWLDRMRVQKPLKCNYDKALFKKVSRFL